MLNVSLAPQSEKAKVYYFSEEKGAQKLNSSQLSE